MWFNRLFLLWKILIERKFGSTHIVFSKILTKRQYGSIHIVFQQNFDQKTIQFNPESILKTF